MKLASLISYLLDAFSPAIKEEVPGAVNGTTSHYINLRNQTYHYLHAYPADNVPAKGNVLLFHGLPDFSYGWHRQIPFLSSLGYRVIAPDMLGVSRSFAPCAISRYTFKEIGADMATLIDEVLGPDAQVIVGGHDWGAGMAYKFPMLYPSKTKAVFAMSFPYTKAYYGPNAEWTDLDDLVKDGTFPTWGYQLQWRQVSFDRNFTTKGEIRNLLTALVGGSTADGRYAISEKHGILYDVLPDVVPESGFLKGEELDIYVDALHQNGVRSEWNSYRTRRMNYEDEIDFPKAGEFVYKLPALFIPSLQDLSVLPRYYNENMRSSFENLTIEPLDASHWLMLEDSDGVNRIVGNWLRRLE
ncbi:hypothetical protein GRF29_185g633893 [Pseudopithomyces chartarum]|uniref:AB hydrolase-1 domain-containing protein n=1 Tax=Pseudopithomyces chartarum TaxID=1892770 RepID=A0AAN6LNA2_9PLEO|nr:hypothetical protein GRF29_185g633893 [Pseudopithomyces chartarum]